MLTVATPSPTCDSGVRSAAPAGTICQVLHSLTIGGAEVLAAELARRLADRYRFVFACLDDLGLLGEQLRREGFLVEVLGRKSGFDVRCVRRLAEFARAQHVDLIHAHQYTPFFYSRAPGTLDSPSARLVQRARPVPSRLPAAQADDFQPHLPAALRSRGGCGKCGP
jgi:hypothetical protein